MDKLQQLKKQRKLGITDSFRMRKILADQTLKKPHYLKNNKHTSIEKTKEVC